MLTMKGNINVYLDISWNIKDIEYIDILIYTLYWIYIYGILLLYVYTWIFQVYANAIDIFLVKSLQKMLLCFCAPADSISYINTSQKWKKMKRLLCCKSLGPASVCFILTQSSMLEWECFQCVIKEQESICGTVSLSLYKSLCAKRRTAHTAALCECVI